MDLKLLQSVTILSAISLPSNATAEPELIDMSVSTAEPELIDMSVSTAESELIDMSVSTAESALTVISEPVDNAKRVNGLVHVDDSTSPIRQNVGKLNPANDNLTPSYLISLVILLILIEIKSLFKEKKQQHLLNAADKSVRDQIGINTALKNELASVKATSSSFAKQLNEANKKIRDQIGEIDALKNELASVNAACSSLSQQLNEANKKIRDQIEVIAANADAISTLTLNAQFNEEELNRVMQEQAHETITDQDKLMLERNAQLIEDLQKELDLARQACASSAEEIVQLRQKLLLSQRKTANLTKELSEVIRDEEVDAAIVEAQELINKSKNFGDDVAKLMSVLLRHQGKDMGVSYVVLTTNAKVMVADLGIIVEKLLLKYCGSEDPYREQNYVKIAPIVHLLEQCRNLLDQQKYKELYESIYRTHGHFEYFTALFGASNSESQAVTAEQMPNIESVWLSSKGELWDLFALYEIHPTNTLSPENITELGKKRKKLAIKYHPDSNPNVTQEVQILINIALEILSDPDSLSKYFMAHQHFINNNLKFAYV